VRKVLLIVVLLKLVAWTWLCYLGRMWGSTMEERRRRLPGDELIPDARIIGDHAIEIDTPVAAVWPWLVQVGWHRAGWYTYRWVDRLLFPDNLPSSDFIVRLLVPERHQATSRYHC